MERLKRVFGIKNSVVKPERELARNLTPIELRQAVTIVLNRQELEEAKRMELINNLVKPYGSSQAHMDELKGIIRQRDDEI